MTVRVLVADDDAEVRAALVRILTSSGAVRVVGQAADGAQAVSAARRLRPDVALVDIRMPVLDGIEVAARLAAPGGDPVKVVLITTFDLDEYVYAGLRAGASGFLLKDAGPEELVRAVQVVARGDALLAPRVTRRLLDRFASADAAAFRLPDLTPRERDVLTLVAEGLSNAEIAERLVVSAETVKTYVARLLAKLGVRDRVQIVVLAHRSGLVRSAYPLWDQTLG